ncbi:MAG: M14 family zinc carboxypeptidase [Bacteroidota bacterium]
MNHLRTNKSALFILLFFLPVLLAGISTPSYSRSSKGNRTGGAVKAAATQEKFNDEIYQRIVIYTGEAGIKRLVKAGVAMDHGLRKKGYSFTGEFSESEVALIKASGLRYEVLVKDVSKDFLERNAKDAETYNFDEQVRQINSTLSTQSVACPSNAVHTVPANFRLGSMGGYLTYEEILANLDSMAAKYPNIISARLPLNDINSIEGRPMFYMRISDNPALDEDEPEGLYTALHHAREPGSVSQLVFYMWYLLENYENDPEIRAIVNNTEQYFIPVVNPDGYKHNQTTNPAGGGMWRKNRRRNSSANRFGTDLNRNYGAFWGLDDSGSSPDEGNDTYRGTTAFSEPETQAVRWLCDNHHFRRALNYHTFGNDLIYPWGHLQVGATPDSNAYTAMCEYMTEENQYFFGLTFETLAYTTNGDSDDWMYGEQTEKNKILALTPEVGESFWPARSSILPLCVDNMHQNLVMARLLLPFAIVRDISPTLQPRISRFLKYEVRSIGDSAAGNFTVSLRVLNPGSTASALTRTYALNPLQSKTDSMAFSFSGISDSATVKFELSVDNGVFVVRDTITKYFGTLSTVFASNCNQSISGWDFGSWSLTDEDFISGPYSLTDSPYAPYDDNSVNEVFSAVNFSLENAAHASIQFNAKWQLEKLYDGVHLSVSTNDGATWTPVCGRYTHAGSGIGVQDRSEPWYDGIQKTWVREEINLDQFVGQPINIKLGLMSDQGTALDGFYADDILLTKIAAPAVGNLPLQSNVTNWHLWPNPAKGSLTLVLGKTSTQAGQSPATLCISDMQGRVVLQQNLAGLKASGKALQAETDISMLKPGIYVCKISGIAGATGFNKLVVAE